MSLRCAIYTRKSTEEGLDQDFNSLDAQREACAAYIHSQRAEGWKLVTTLYDDGGYSGGNLERPALQRLLADIDAGKIQLIVVYKIDRLTRSLSDFAKLVERLDARNASFVSVTQSFNTTTSMGRLTLNVLLSFAQFEREVTGERIRDKIAASKKKGMWMGGCVPLGYDRVDRKLVVNEDEARAVRRIFELYATLGNVAALRARLDAEGIRSKVRQQRDGRQRGGALPSTGALFAILRNRIYRGEIAHKMAIHEGQHEAIVAVDLWDAVQATLERTSQRKTVRANANSPLRSLVRTPDDVALEPVHTTKGGRRYRYYVSKPAIPGGTDAPKTMRLPAIELEHHVAKAMTDLLTDEHALLQALIVDDDPAEGRKRVIDQARTLAQVPEAEHWTTFRPLIERIVVQSDGVDLVVNAPRLRSVLLPDSRPADIPGTLTRTIPIVLHRTGHDLRLVVNNGPAAGEAGRLDRALVRYIARGQEWYRQLTTGERTSVRAIAQAEGLCERHVARILTSSLLAPEIIERILQGRQPVGLTARSLRERPPMLWAAQRRRWSLEDAPKHD
jgi:DNA invertase Pin-like site-specific DNA recombinase